MQIKSEYLKEFIKCKKNPLYFIMNYAYAPITGGKVKMDKNSLLPKHRAYIKAIYRLHNVIFLASRRSYKSTLTAAYILWCILFHPNYKAVIINYKKDTAKENINMIKFIYENLPDYFKAIAPKKWKAERIEYFELKNGSKVEIKVPSSALPPDQLGRGFNYAFVYIDEAAFLPLNKILGSIQPAYESARRQAQRTNYPYGMVLTSTPNGMQGLGEQFYRLYSYATPIEELYSFEKEDWIEKPPEKLLEKILQENPYRNNFVRIKLHWSEFPDRDETWAENIKREIEYYTSPEGKRRWNQEYDLLFLGSEQSLFDDDIISKFESKKHKYTIDVGYGAKVKFWEDLNENDYYVIGIDTAKSVTGDYSAIEVFNSNFEQVAELKYRFGKVKRFAESIKNLLLFFIKNNVKNFKLFIENNSYGNQIVEELEYYSEYNFLSHMHYTVKKNGDIEYGITTTSKTKDLMVNALYELIVENPKRIKSQDLISELQLIEIKNGKIGAPKGYHDDLFMAAALSAYGYRELIRQGEITLDMQFKAKQKEKIEKALDNIVVYNPLKEDLNSIQKENNFDYNDKDKDFPLIFV